MGISELTAEQYPRWVKDAGFSELSQILYWRWDPVGVSDDFPATVDEYDTYATMLLGRLRKEPDPQDILAFLISIEKEWMGDQLSTDTHLQEVAGLIVNWRVQSMLGWLDDEGH